MGFNFEYTGPTVADIYRPAFSSPAFTSSRAAFPGEALQPYDGVLVAAVLAPHHGVHAQFGEVRGTAQDGFYAFKFVCCKSKLFGGFYCGLHELMKV